MNAYDRGYLWELLKAHQWRYAFNAFTRWLKAKRIVR